LLRILHPDSCPAERRYVLDVVLHEFLGLDYQAQAAETICSTISLAGDPAGRSLTLPDLFFRLASLHWLDRLSMPTRPVDTWDTSEAVPAKLLLAPRLPVIYGKPGPSGSYFEEAPQRIALGIDVFGSAFFCLTRYEEMVERTRDEHDRFPARGALAFQEGFLERPIIDEYVEVLWYALSRLWPALRRIPREYRFRLTHDVDLPWVVAGRRPAEIVRSLGADVLIRKDAGLLLRRLVSAGKVGRRAFDSDPANTFALIMSLSEELGVQSEFYFICGHTQAADGNYSADEPWIRELLTTIHCRGHVIGLHPSRGTYDNLERLRQEFGTLRRTCEELGIRQERWGGRQHYLQWKNPITWRNWEAVGLAYDSSLTYPEQTGFRCGICREYPVYDLGTRSSLRLRERPLILMEGTLLANMKVGHSSALAWTWRLAESCRKFNGEFVLLWHNNMLAGRLERRLYRDMLAAISA
jgi:hypothetical protein